MSISVEDVVPIKGQEYIFNCESAALLGKLLQSNRIVVVGGEDEYRNRLLKETAKKAVASLGLIIEYRDGLDHLFNPVSSTPDVVVIDNIQAISVEEQDYELFDLVSDKSLNVTYLAGVPDLSLLTPATNSLHDFNQIHMFDPAETLKYHEIIDDYGHARLIPRVI